MTSVRLRATSPKLRAIWTPGRLTKFLGELPPDAVQLRTTVTDARDATGEFVGWLNSRTEGLATKWEELMMMGAGMFDR